MRESKAEGEGFEPPEGVKPSAAFKAAPFDRSGTPPIAIFTNIIKQI